MKTAPSEFLLVSSATIKSNTTLSGIDKSNKIALGAVSVAG